LLVCIAGKETDWFAHNDAQRSARCWFQLPGRGASLRAHCGGVRAPLYESYPCGSERNYTKYCNPEVEKLIDQQSRETDLQNRRKLV
jgi:ABC-type transport system substrate-binding protein